MLPESMYAVVCHGPHDYRYERVPTPRAAEDGIVLKVEACGICAGDLKAYQGGDRFWGGGEFTAYVEPPCIPGHEFVGRIAEVGEHASPGFCVGERVTAEQILPCGTCAYCRAGLYWLCGPHDVFGFKHYLNGGMAEYIRLPRGSRVHRVPESLSTKQALLIEPYACAMHGVDRAAVTRDDVVVVSGAGTLGLGMIAYLRTLQPRCLVAVDVQDSRLPIAKALGAHLALNPQRENVQRTLQELSGGLGCDVYIEVAGHPSSVLQGLQWVRKAGRFVEFSVFTEKTTSDWSIIGDAKELSIIGSSLSPHCFAPTIEGITSGKLRTQGVVTDVLPLQEFETAFRLAKSGGIKVALHA